MKPGYDARLRDILSLHFDPNHGSRYWLDREQALGLSVLREVRTIDDLHKLGPMPLEDLSARPVTDFVPRRFLDAKRALVTAETGGATGAPKATAYFEDEFEEIFVRSFLRIASEIGLEPGPWLWIGPGGPHIIGKAAAAISRRMTGRDAFAVDFDPRWYRTLAPDSLARRRYLAHLLDQAERVAAREHIVNLFSTPVVLTALADRLDERTRRRIRGIYLGGMAIEPTAVAKLSASFENARLIAGYGNTLFGVCHARQDLRHDADNIRYFAEGSRLVVKLIPADEDIATERRLQTEAAEGESGQVMFHRLDESVFLPNVLERDTARRGADGAIENPAPLISKRFTVDAGIY